MIHKPLPEEMFPYLRPDWPTPYFESTIPASSRPTSETFNLVSTPSSS